MSDEQKTPVDIENLVNTLRIIKNLYWSTYQRSFLDWKQNET